MEIFYRRAVPSDIDPICNLIARAINTMEMNGIFDLDEIYPTRENFVEDINKGYCLSGFWTAILQ